MLRRWFLGCVLLVGGCVQNSVKDPSEQTQGPLSVESIAVDQSHPNDAKVSELAIRYINQECYLSPETATSWGVHQYDEKLDDYSLQAHKAHTTKLKELLKRLESINPNEGLSAAGRTDWDQLRSTLVVQIKNAELRDPLVLQPDYYVKPLGALFLMYSRDYAPAEERAKYMIARIEKIPAVLAMAEKNLGRPPKIWTEIAIDRAVGGIEFLTEVTTFLQSHMPGEKQRVDVALNHAKEAFKQYKSFLENQVKPRSDGNFAAGKEYFEFLLKNDAFLNKNADQVFALGQTLSTKIQSQMRDVAKKIDPNAKDWPEVVNKVKTKHPKANELIATYRNEVQRARDFLAKKDVVPFPPGDDCQVIETPAFLRTTLPSAAYDQPPPFEKSTRGYFFVTPVDTSQSPEKQEESLRENDFGDIVDTAVHEAYPGHHLQLSMARNTPSYIRKITGPSIFVEGWALYSEELMAELGYYNDEERLMQLEWALVRAARVVIDVGLHTRSMSTQEAEKMLTEVVHLEPSLAHGEVKRYTQDPTQPLSYLVGREQIFELREKYKKKMGDKFSLKEFHREILTRGTLAPGLLAKEILGEAL